MPLFSLIFHVLMISKINASVHVHRSRNMRVRCSKISRELQEAVEKSDVDAQLKLISRIPALGCFKNTPELKRALYWAVYTEEDEKLAMKYLNLG